MQTHGALVCYPIRVAQMSTTACAEETLHFATLVQFAFEDEVEKAGGEVLVLFVIRFFVYGNERKSHKSLYI